jgi:hypothetical protein
MFIINLLKTAGKTFATGNAIYPLPRTIIHDNSIFRKEGIPEMAEETEKPESEV